MISITTHSLHGWFTRAALKAKITSILHKVGSANVPCLILSVFVQKKASEVSLWIIDLTGDLLVREQERAIRSSTRRVIGAVERRVTDCR